MIYLFVVCTMGQSQEGREGGSVGGVGGRGRERRRRPRINHSRRLEREREGGRGWIE